MVTGVIKLRNMVSTLRLLLLTLVLLNSEAKAVTGADEEQLSIAIRLQRGEEALQLGNYSAAAADFHAVLVLDSDLTTTRQKSRANLGLGLIRTGQRRLDEAAALLNQANRLARATGSNELHAVTANALANLYVANRQSEEARESLAEALAAASRANNPLLSATTRVNLARLLAKRDFDSAIKESIKALNEVRNAPESERTAVLLAVGEQLRQLGELGVVPSSWLKACHDALLEAAELGVRLDLPRVRSQAYGLLGALYEQQGREQEAILLSEEAILSHAATGGEDLLMQWEWRLGRLLEKSGDTERAMAAYRRAVDHVESIRNELPVVYSDGRSSFRVTLAPLYLDLADLLLRQTVATTGQKRQDLLAEARDLAERIKSAELGDYFNDPCAFEQQNFQQESRSAPAGSVAILHPIILPDRIELLLSRADEIHQATVRVRSRRLARTVRTLASSLRLPPQSATNISFAEREAHLLYRWLIKPVESWIENIDTLLFIPDGVLRLIPLAALMDRDQFLIERFSISTSPGFTLIDMDADPDRLSDSRNRPSLIAGLALPGPVVKQLPENILARQLADIDSQTRGTSPLNRPEGELDETKSLHDLLEDPARLELVQQALALPDVPIELEAVISHFPGQVLRDDRFTLKRFSEALTTGDHGLVHIASHGVFGSSAEETFILTFDELLDSNQFENLLRQAGGELELLALSACQTAEGDDRAPLGLGGIALLSGAKSAIGSLWPVADSSTRELFTELYRQLSDDRVGKAEALRRAQRKLLADRRYRHPFFWAPFILVGNWL
jgi:CHAT domain-containing protein